MATWNKGIDANRLMGLEYALADAAESCKSALLSVEEPSKSEHIYVHVQFVGELLYFGEKGLNPWCLICCTTRIKIGKCTTEMGI